jgi:hypothetical protein
MTPEQCKSMYRRLIGSGEPVFVRRYAGTGADRPYYQVPVRARVMEYQAQELIGPIQQGDQKVILLAEDLVAQQFEMPLRKGDKIVVRGRELNIEAPDDNTRRIAGVLIAYDLRVRG